MIETVIAQEEVMIRSNVHEKETTNAEVHTLHD